jgi:hypothetical protein
MKTGSRLAAWIRFFFITIMIAMKIFNQDLIETVKLRFAEKFSIKVRLRKVEQVCLNPFGHSITAAG